MTNIVRLPPFPTANATLDVDKPLALVQRLFSANLLSKHAYFLGIIMISHFQANGQFSGILTRQDAYRTHVLLDDEPISGAVSCELDQFANALCALQNSCGFYSAVNSRVSKLKDRFTHFTDEHRRTQPLTEIIKHNTPISFEYRVAEESQILAQAKENIEHQLLIAKFARITLRQ